VTTACVPLELMALTKTFPTPSGPVVAIEDVNAHVDEGEFVCILGHSGCGKSTVLSIVAGLQAATRGAVAIDGRIVEGPGTDRALVFQAPCLLPWLTARENVVLAVASRSPASTSAQRRSEANRYLALVGVDDAADQWPSELSPGTQQCVSLARALALEPRFLLLDEPFSTLDSLTRFGLQDTLLHVWDRDRAMVVMVTHDIDEALYLADRVMLMTDGPAARIGDILSVPFPRPRERAAVLEHAQFYDYRCRIIDFLERHARQSRVAP